MYLYKNIEEIKYKEENKKQKKKDRKLYRVNVV